MWNLESKWTILIPTVADSWVPPDRGPHSSVTQKQSSGAAQGLRGQSSMTASSPVVTSTHDDPYDLTHRLHHLAGPLVGASDDGGGHGGSEERDGGATPVEATTKQAQALMSFYGLRRT